MTAVAIPHMEEHHDPEGSRFGMWLFLLTEILLFAGIFLLYAVYRFQFPEDFHYGATTLHTLVGGVNTLILLTSSLTMVLSIAKLVRGERRGAVVLLGATIVLGLSFLVVKIFEWKDKIGHGLFPGSEELMEHTAGENLFYGLYFGMTGLHALHVVIGLGVLAVMLCRIARKPRRTVRIPAPGNVALSLAAADGRELWDGVADDDVDGVEVTLIFSKNEKLLEREVTRLENAGLYWHLVDVIWIFLFPFLYLIT